MDFYEGPGQSTCQGNAPLKVKNQSQDLSLDAGRKQHPWDPVVLVLIFHRLHQTWGRFMIDTAVGKGHFSVFLSSQTSLVR